MADTTLTPDDIRDFVQKARAFDWLVSKLQAAYDGVSVDCETVDGANIYVNCGMIFGHKERRRVESSIQWEDARDEPLDLLGAISQHLPEALLPEGEERERLLFEAAVINADDEHADFGRREDGTYRNIYLECAWGGWRARTTLPGTEGKTGGPVVVQTKRDQPVTKPKERIKIIQILPAPSHKSISGDLHLLGLDDKGILYTLESTGWCLHTETFAEVLNDAT